MALQVIKPFIGNQIDDNVLLDIILDTLDFKFPIVELTEKIASLELFHGPTLAFKDVGARFMARTLGYFNKIVVNKLFILFRLKMKI